MPCGWAEPVWGSSLGLQTPSWDRWPWQGSCPAHPCFWGEVALGSSGRLFHTCQAPGCHSMTLATLQSMRPQVRNQMVTGLTTPQFSARTCSQGRKSQQLGPQGNCSKLTNAALMIGGTGRALPGFQIFLQTNKIYKYSLQFTIGKCLTCPPVLHACIEIHKSISSELVS